jgi:hypothetical protein
MKWLKKFRNKNKETIQEVKDTSKKISTVVKSNVPQYILLKLVQLKFMKYKNLEITNITLTYIIIVTWYFF